MSAHNKRSNMSNWDRKKLLALADAIRECLKEKALTDIQKLRLEKLYALANNGSKNFVTSPDQVTFVRSELCRVYREESLCKCDKENGWSDNCSFERSNR